ncbi:MAG: LysR substrate-binding domain-containing protein [Myxococcaceae bacterium]
MTVRVRPVLEANNSLALREAALQGLGVARLPKFTVAEQLEAGTLVRVLKGWDFEAQGIYAVTTAREYQPRKTRAFIDFFREQLKKVPSA